jgi:hypothetical protein
MMLWTSLPRHCIDGLIIVADEIKAAKAARRPLRKRWRRNRHPLASRLFISSYFCRHNSVAGLLPVFVADYRDAPNVEGVRAGVQHGLHCIHLETGRA